MFRSNRTPPRPTRLSLEALEGRTLLSTTPLPETQSLVPGYASVSFERVSRALSVVDNLVNASPPSSQGGATPDPVTVDLDGDGVPDTISLQHAPGGRSDTLQIAYGESSLHPPMIRTMSLDFTARQLLVGDFDGDGHPDIFVTDDQGDSSRANANSPGGLLLMGRSDGFYDAYRRTDDYSSFAVADLQTPGVDNFIYGNAPVAQATASGVGGVQAAAVATDWEPASDIQCVDVDGDGTPDIVTCSGDGRVQIYAGLGGGRFSTAPIQVADSFAGTGPVHVAFAHLEDSPSDEGKKGNSPLDMVVVSSSRSEVAVFHGLGRGRFHEEQLMAVGLAPSSVILGDVTNDGISDLIVTSAGSNSLWIFRGLGDGRFDEKHPLILSTGEDPTTAFVGNFDGNGKGEIVTLDHGSNSLTFYRDATDPHAQPVRISSGGVGPTAAVLRDVNGDGYDDLVVANRDSGQVSLFYGGPAGLHMGQTISRPGTHPAALAVGPGLPSNYQVYVMDEGGSQAQILSFESAAADGSAGLEPRTVEAPKLDSTPEVRLFFQPTSDSTAESVPILLVAQPEGEEAGPVERHSPTQVPPVAPATCRSGQPTAAVLAMRGAVETVEPSESRDPAAPTDIASQRTLLGLEDIPAPALGPAAADRSALPALPAEPEGVERAVESVPVRSVARQTTTVEADAFDAAAEAPTDSEPEAVAAGDVLIGVVLALGLPGGWGENPGARPLTQAAGRRERR